MTSQSDCDPTEIPADAVDVGDLKQARALVGSCIARALAYTHGAGEGDLGGAITGP